jgi:fermentation-respiration switch protein FrsA (DUF1100 family)
VIIISLYVPENYRFRDSISITLNDFEHLIFIMPRKNIEFKNNVGVTLRGWLYTPTDTTEKPLPCLVMEHGFSAVKEMGLDTFAEVFIGKLNLAVVIYDNRGFGNSDVATGQPRLEIIPSDQIYDFQDAITYAQSLPQVDPERIGIWGSSYAGGNAIVVAATDKRVRAIISQVSSNSPSLFIYKLQLVITPEHSIFTSQIKRKLNLKLIINQVPFVDGPTTFSRIIRPDAVAGLNAAFQADRIARADGKPAATLPVATNDPLVQAALPTSDCYPFFSQLPSELSWKNEVTLRSMELMRGYAPHNLIEYIAPTPLLMIVQDRDVLTASDLSLKAFAKALEPKELLVLKGGHFEAYTAANLGISIQRQVEFLQKTLCI